MPTSEPRAPYGWLDTEIVQTADAKFMVLSNDAIADHLRRGEPWEPHLTAAAAELVDVKSNVVDVGANIGYTTVMLSRLVGPLGHVTSFEPQRIVYQQLCGNCFLNGLHNVLAYNLALGTENNKISEMEPVDYRGSAMNVMDSALGAGGDSVVMMTLDWFALSNVSLIKIDVQGYELGVLQGARETIKKSRPFLFVEIDSRQLERFGIAIEKLFAELHYQQYSLLLLNIGDSTDYIAIPSEKHSYVERLKACLPCAQLIMKHTLPM